MAATDVATALVRDVEAARSEAPGISVVFCQLLGVLLPARRSRYVDRVHGSGFGEEAEHRCLADTRRATADDDPPILESLHARLGLIDVVASDPGVPSADELARVVIQSVGVLEVAVFARRGVDVRRLRPQRRDRALLPRDVCERVELIEPARVLPGDLVDLVVRTRRPPRTTS